MRISSEKGSEIFVFMPRISFGMFFFFSGQKNLTDFSDFAIKIQRYRFRQILASNKRRFNIDFQKFSDITITKTHRIVTYRFKIYSFGVYLLSLLTNTSNVNNYSRMVVSIVHEITKRFVFQTFLPLELALAMGNGQLVWKPVTGKSKSRERIANIDQKFAMERLSRLKRIIKPVLRLRARIIPVLRKWKGRRAVRAAY